MKVLRSRSLKFAGTPVATRIAREQQVARLFAAPGSVRVTADRPASATKPRAKPEKRITFVGIGGVCSDPNAESDAVRVYNQQRIDAIWDRAAVTSGIVKRGI
jgi:hypothetical protein